MPRLDKLLKEPTVIVLGAGASADYGFPLWDGLKTQFLNHVGNDKDWRYLFEEYHNNSIDRIASYASDEQLEQFQNFIIQMFFSLETKIAADKIEMDRRWINNFSQIFFHELELDIQLAAQRFKNLTIINLNYDRVFDYEFHLETARFKKRALPNSIRKRAYFADTGIDENDLKLNIIHPHGCIGRLNSHNIIQTGPGTRWLNSFDEKNFSWTSERKHISKCILPIELIKCESATTSYTTAIDAVNQAKNLIVVGVSKLGWNDSELSASPDISRCYCTGEALTPDFSTIARNALDFVAKL